MRTRGATAVRVAEAWAPGHVTFFFVPEVSGADPRARGSVGAGVVVDRGARVLALQTHGPVGALRVVAERPGSYPISSRVARRLLGTRRVACHILMHHELPVGQGFGMSAAGATGTALALSSLERIPTTRAFTEAHLADLEGGGGLGGVAAIGGGGWEFRRDAGILPFGRVEHRPFPYRLLVGWRAPPLSSPRVLSRRELFERATAAGTEALSALAADPTPDHLLELGEKFTDRLGLASPAMRRVMTKLRRSGLRVAQGMFGHSLVASVSDRPTSRRATAMLENAGYTVALLRASRSGARLRAIRG